MARAELADETVDEVYPECRDSHPEHTYYPIVVCAVPGQHSKPNRLPLRQYIREQIATLHQWLEACRIRARGLADGAALRLRGRENELAMLTMRRRRTDGKLPWSGLINFGKYTFCYQITYTLLDRKVLGELDGSSPDVMRQILATLDSREKGLVLT
jgi:hypothetical protein